jgi:hypothetical protein
MVKTSCTHTDHRGSIKNKDFRNDKRVQDVHTALERK